MEQSLKNIFLLGAALLFMMIFWVFFEISKSHALIEYAEDPKTSIQRGISEAQRDFEENHAHFRQIFIEGKGWIYPGVLDQELEGEYEGYFWGYGWCGTSSPLEKISLNITTHEQNENYAMAYNLELIKLLHREKNI